MATKTLKDLFEDTIKDIYSSETQLLAAMPKMMEAAQDPELKSAIKTHAEESQKQVERIEQIAKMLDFAPDGVTCEGTVGLLKEATEHIEEFGGTPAGDAAIIACAQKNEHYEIANYGTAVTFAQQLGYPEAEELLKQTLNEEEQTDQKLTHIAKSGRTRWRSPTTKDDMARSDQYDHVDAATNAASRPEAEKPDMDAIRAGGTGSAGSGTDPDESPILRVRLNDCSRHLGGLHRRGRSRHERFGRLCPDPRGEAVTDPQTNLETGAESREDNDLAERTDGDTGLGGMSDGSSSGSPLHSNVLQDGMTQVGSNEPYRETTADQTGRSTNNQTAYTAGRQHRACRRRGTPTTRRRTLRPRARARSSAPTTSRRTPSSQRSADILSATRPQVEPCSPTGLGLATELRTGVSALRCAPDRSHLDRGYRRALHAGVPLAYAVRPLARQVAARDRLARRGRRRVLPPAPECARPPERRGDQAPLDGQRHPHPRRAAGGSLLQKRLSWTTARRRSPPRRTTWSSGAARATPPCAASPPSGSASTPAPATSSGTNGAPRLSGASGAFHEEGLIEVITSGATHGYQPLLGTDESCRAQVRLGRRDLRAALRHEAARHLAPRVRLPPPLRLEVAGGARCRALPEARHRPDPRHRGARVLFRGLAHDPGRAPLGTYGAKFPQLAELFARSSAVLHPARGGALGVRALRPAQRGHRLRARPPRRR